MLSSLLRFVQTAGVCSLPSSDGFRLQEYGLFPPWNQKEGRPKGVQSSREGGGRGLGIRKRGGLRGYKAAERGSVRVRESERGAA
eukprot:1188581-Prorocentrum_minimum.AAC.6